MADSTPEPDAPEIRPAKSTRRQIVRGCLAGLGVVLGVELFYALLGTNFRTVVPGRAYRSARLSGEALEQAIKDYGIRTVINLRGCCEPAPWYLEQSRILNRHNVSMEDVGCSAGRLPSVVTIRQLVQILDQTEYPVLIHCHRGIDRTGMVAAILLLLQTDISLDTALQQLSWRYAHFPFGKTGNMERFFVLYREWLKQTGQAHSRAVFRRWIEHDYCPGECQAQIELAEVVAPGVVARSPDRATAELTLAPHKPTLVKVRCVNTSIKPWTFKPGLTAGIHLQYMLHDDQDRSITSARAGQFYATVAPGESIVLALPFPALPPGRYLLRADLIDEQHASFFQLGSLPLIREVLVRER